ncbi:MAG: hypothetical protein HOP18_17380 [Deltaproteobacteria bacterium]|nr:hypothetical protein [Deltaproteobacteria bacterium]
MAILSAGNASVLVCHCGLRIADCRLEHSATSPPSSNLRARVWQAATTVAFLVLLLFFSCHVHATSASPFPAASVVEGHTARDLQGQAIANLSAFAFIGQTLTPIPFQVDERDHRDRWILDHGARLTGDETPGLLDANDVLVFMNRDVGERGVPALSPTNATIWLEVRVGTDMSPVGFVYIGVFATPPAFQPPHIYARYDAETDRVYAERYALAFGAPLPTHLAFVEQVGDFGTNMITGVHAVGDVRLLGGLLSLHRSDKDIRMEIVGSRSGPVRAVRRARYWIPLPLGFRAQGRFDLLFYRDFVEGTTTVNVKLPPRLVLADGELKTYFAFLPLPDAQPLLEGERERDLTIRWAALPLPDGKAVLLVVRLEGALQRLGQQLYFENAPTEQADGGSSTGFGFLFTHINRLTTGTHRLSVFAMVLESTQPEDIRRAVDAFLTPPVVTVAVVRP